LKEKSQENNIQPEQLRKFFKEQKKKQGSGKRSAFIVYDIVLLHIS
jgi:hypothetical protein